MSQDVAILDFGSGGITVMLGCRAPSDNVSVTSFAEVKYAGFQKGEWLCPDLLLDAIKGAISQAEDKTGQKIEHVYIGVPGEFCLNITKMVSVTFDRRKKITHKDVKELLQKGTDALFSGNTYTDLSSIGAQGTGGQIKHDLSGMLLINRQPVFYTLDDGTPMIDPEGSAARKLSGLISYVFTAYNFYDRINRIMDSLGLGFEYVCAPLAQALFLLDSYKRDGTSVLIDIGDISSTVAVVKGDGLLSLKSFSMGGGYITADLYNYFKVPIAVAEMLKRKALITRVPDSDDCYEVDEHTFDAMAVNEIIITRLRRIAGAVKKCLSLCEFEIPVTAGFYLTGGGISLLRGARELVGQELTADLEPVSHSLPDLSNPRLSSSVGLLNMVMDSYTAKSRRSFLGFILGEQ